MNSKNTKRALLTSVLAMAVCLAMLVGSTFAWFTDTATTGVNKIVSGNLKVDIVSKEGTSLQGKTFTLLRPIMLTRKSFGSPAAHMLPSLSRL